MSLSYSFLDVGLRSAGSQAGLSGKGLKMWAFLCPEAIPGKKCHSPGSQGQAVQSLPYSGPQDPPLSLLSTARAGGAKVRPLWPRILGDTRAALPTALHTCLAELPPSQAAFQLSQRFSAPPTFISFLACGLSSEGKQACHQCQAMLRLRPVGSQSPVRDVANNMHVSGMGVCEQLYLWGGLGRGIAPRSF